MSTEIECSNCGKCLKRGNRGRHNLVRHMRTCPGRNPAYGPHPFPHLVVCLRRETFEFTPENAPHLYIQLDLLAEKVSPSVWFPGLEKLQSFPNFYERQDDQIAIHQSLVTAFFLQRLSTDSNNFKASIQEWHPKLFNDFRDCGSPRITFLFLDTTDGHPMTAPEPWVTAAQLKDRPPLNLYPSQQEMEMEQGKVDFVKILNSIAESAEESRFQFRPITCFGTGICPLLENERTVYKRSWSASSSHVRVETSRLPGVPCLPFVHMEPTRKRKRTQLHSGQDNTHIPWFHQQYLPLVAKGEFRLFISRGEVFHWVHTAVNRDNQDTKDLVVVTKSLGDESMEFRGKKTTEKDRMDFALYIYKHLRMQLPNMSFDDGVRLDIGAGPDGRLWVIEITPWYSAHYFPMTGLPFPNTQICEKFARSLADFICFLPSQ